MLDKSKSYFIPTNVLFMIMGYLDSRELCRCAQVSWSWYYINKSLDNTRWKQLFLRDFRGIFNCRSALIYFQKVTEIRNDLIDEDYLMNTFIRHVEDKTWKDLYRNHFNWKRLWKLRSEEVLPKSCGCIISPLLDKSEIHIGPSGYQYSSIREAMANTHPYCTVIIHPGNYDEQIKLSVTKPLQIIGHGHNSPVTMYFDCDTSAVRMCNVFIKSPWFSETLIKVRGGLVQLESCNLTNGEIHVTSPGVLTMRYCSLNNAKISFIRSCCSTIEHCEFTNNIDFNEFIHIEGAPKYERITACSFLMQEINKWLPLYSYKDGLESTKLNKTKNKFKLKRKTRSCDNVNLFMPESRSNSRRLSSQLLRDHVNSFPFDFSKIQKMHTQINLSLLKEYKIMHCLPNFNINGVDNSNYVKEKWRENSCDDIFCYGHKKLIKEVMPKSIDRKSYSKFITKCCLKQGIKQIIDDIKGPLLINCNFSNSKFVINCILDAKVIVISCEMSSCGDLIRLSRLSKALIYRNRMHHSTGCAICLKHESEAVVIGNEIYGMVECAIEIRKNTFPHILANKIHSNEKYGISFVSNNGQVEFNDICYNKVGISILHSSNPIIRSNTIRANKSHGVIINERSISILDDNLIMKNEDSNILIRKSSNPVITSNFIYLADSDGIQIEGCGKGTIANNIIMGNMRNGISLLNADLPYIYGNQICHNKLHGIHIGRLTMDNDDIISEDQDDFESRSLMSYCDTTYSSDYEDIDYSRNCDVNDLDEKLSNLYNDEQWTRRKHSLIYIKFNSIYYNKGCGISNETNIALEILNNAIHANSEDGVSLMVPGVFGLTYGSPKLSFVELKNESLKKSYSQKPAVIVNTFLLEYNNDEQQVKVINRKIAPYVGDNQSQWKTRHRTLGQILKNSITNNGANGIIINTTHFSAARFVIVGNGIYDNQGSGLSIQTECEIMGNDILGNNKPALQAKSHGWVYLTMNRLYSVNTTAISVHEPPVTLICKNNIVYTSTLQSDVIRVIADNNKCNKDKFSVECFNSFRSANGIEYMPDSNIYTTFASSQSKSFINHHSSENTTIGFQNYPLRPIIIKDTHTRVSVALSDALNSLNRSPRSEICHVL